MKYHDNDTYAVNPLHLTLSTAKLDDLLPELTRNRGLVKRLLRALRGRPDLLDVLAEHIYCADSQPAIVVQTDPLLIAAYSVDLDCVAMLRFSTFFTQKYELGPESRLVTINTYCQEQSYQPDLIPGPHREFTWTSFHPVVADFVSDDVRRIEDRKASIDQGTWEYVHLLGSEYVRAHPNVFRDGRPFMSGVPLFDLGQNDMVEGSEPEA